MKTLICLITFATLLFFFAPSFVFGKADNLRAGSAGDDKRTAQMQKDPSAPDAMPLNLEIISWVEVSFQGGRLREHKSDLESLVRSRIRHELPMLSHEVKPIHELRREILEGDGAPDILERELKKRGCVDCLVWTTGDDDLVVFLTECELAGYGDYEDSRYSAFESRVLDFGSRLSAKRQVEASLTKIIKRISVKFVGAREHLRAFSE
jgi:hypothetical protein